MKNQLARNLSSLLICATVCAGFSTASAAPEYSTRGKPIIITAPAVKDGSNFSRAPYVAARQFDDVKAPDGQAIDLSSPPNTVATNMEPSLRSSRLAVLQKAPTQTKIAVQTISTEPYLVPTGR